MATNTITITACDNELLVLACDPAGSYLLCDVQSGNFQPVDVTLTIQEGAYTQAVTLNGTTSALSQTISQSIPAGDYSIVLLGLNWGGPSQFTVDVNGTTQALPQEQNPGVGLMFSPGPISITV